MQALISEASKHNTVFYYAISPGLDIAYSSQKEIATLKRKLDQVCVKRGVGGVVRDHVLCLTFCKLHQL